MTLPSKFVTRPRTGVVLACAGYRALAAALAIAPWSMAAAQQVGGHPEGDAVLFREGGMLLVETLRMMAPMASRLAMTTLLLTLMMTFGWVALLTALIASLEVGTRGPKALLARAGRHFPVLAAMHGAALLFRGLILAGAIAGGGALARNLNIEPPTADGIRMAGVGVGLLLAWLFTVLHDGARVAVVQRDARLWEALDRAIQPLREGARAMLWAAMWRTFVTVATLLGAIYVTTQLATGSTGDVAVAFVAQAMALLVAVMLRASWLRWLSVQQA